MERLTIRNSDGSVSQPTSTTIQAVFEKLAAYEDLEEQGRLVVLPCKPDATFYRIVGVSIAISCFEGVYVDSGGNITYCCGVGDWIDASDIGKSVFLTRAEAEKAMKGVSEDA